MTSSPPSRPAVLRVLVPAALLLATACGGQDDGADPAAYEQVRGRDLCRAVGDAPVEELLVESGAARFDERSGDVLVGGLDVSEGEVEGLPSCTWTATDAVVGVRVYAAELGTGTGPDGTVTSEVEVGGEAALEQQLGDGAACVDFLPLGDDLWLAVDATLPTGEPCPLTRALAAAAVDDVRGLAAGS
ncbi:hypothetical protein [Nocardioides perillae]|uniref:DUF3558 domain-containing protein n=1 Tax=Nocardioides perillae TaxID=1119534 RepID=A0A7Y9RZ07_9ACTN|nr:hypothetical protein [Nocardioides perillae]